MTFNQTVASRKTLYNLLKLQALESKQGTEPWQIEDYRQWTLEKLFSKLHQVGWKLDKATFIAYSECVQSPQELLELLIGEQHFSVEQEDLLFLVTFELWRRLAPHEANLEILCDELDYQAYAYEQGEHVDHKIELVLSRCAQMLVEQTHSLEEAKVLYQAICDHCAHDFEIFLYDFIADQMQAEAYDYALDLYKRFEPYIKDSLWFSLLKVRLSDNQEASITLLKLLRALETQPQLDLLFEILTYLSEHDVQGYFFCFFDLISKQDLEHDDVVELETLVQLYLEKTDQQAPLRAQFLTILQNRCRKIKN